MPAARHARPKALVSIASACFFNSPTSAHIFWLISGPFSFAGIATALWATNFDQMSVFATFLITPLTYLGGVFYSIQSLPDPWQHLSKLNPILYMVNGFRYGFYGVSDVSLRVSILILVFFVIVLTRVNLYLLDRGIGLKN